MAKKRKAQSRRTTTSTTRTTKRSGFSGEFNRALAKRLRRQMAQKAGTRTTTPTTTKKKSNAFYEDRTSSWLGPAYPSKRNKKRP